MAAPTRWEPGPPATTSTTSTDNSQISALTCTFGPPKHFPSTGYLSPCKTSSNASTTPCSLDIASQIPRPNAARRIAAKTSRPNTTFNKILACKLPHVKFPAIPGLRSSTQNKAGTHQLALSALLGCPIAISAPSSDSYIQAHNGATDNGKTLETAGALPVSDPRRLEKTIIAPHIDLSALPGLRSSI